MAAVVETFAPASLAISGTGLSQVELDALCVEPDTSATGIADCKPQAETDEVNEMDDLLYRMRRTRHFKGAAAAAALKASTMGEVEKASEGLSQQELGELCVVANDTNEDVEEADDFLFRLRRRRGFRDDAAANAMIMEAVVKMRNEQEEKDGNDEVATTASGSLSPPTGGLSQGELDALCVSDDQDSPELSTPEEPGELLFRSRRRRHFVGPEDAEAFARDVASKMQCDLMDNVGGLSQEELDALAYSADEEDSPSADQSDAFPLKVRRTRHFISEEAASTLIAEAVSSAQKEEDAKEADVAASASCASTGTGSASLPLFKEVSSMSSAGAGPLSQAELDAMCVEDSEGGDEPSPPPFIKVTEAVAATRKFGDLSIDTDALCERIQHISTPTRSRRSPTSPSHRSPMSPNPTMTLRSPGSPQRALA